MLFIVLLAGHIFVATTTTVHALLNKSDVRSVIGWIGVAWLSPGFGGILYYAFGINRVARRAKNKNDHPAYLSVHASHNSSVSTKRLTKTLTVFSNAGRQLSGNAVLGGNSFDVLQNGDDAYPKMLTEIENAVNSVCLATYIFRSDVVGHQFADALIRAHQRGVEIRVLIDAVGGGFFSSRVIRKLKSHGVNVARFTFNRRQWSMAFINLRNHKKLLIIDGRKGYVGGLNLGAENSTLYFRKPIVRDIHFQLCGPVVSQLMQDFARDWEFATDELLDAAFWWPQPKVCGDHDFRVMSSGPDEDVGKIETLFALAITAAKSRVRIVTPYFLPDAKLTEAMRLAVLRGVRIEVVLPAKSDHVVVDWAVRSHLSFLKGHGLHYFLAKAPFDHTKLLTVDDHWCAFGSPNWDARSLRLNFELLIECYSPEMVASLNNLIDEKILAARQLLTDELSNQFLLAKIRNAIARLFLPYL